MQLPGAPHDTAVAVTGSLTKEAVHPPPVAPVLGDADGAALTGLWLGEDLGLGADLVGLGAAGLHPARAAAQATATAAVAINRERRCCIWCVIGLSAVVTVSVRQLGMCRGYPSARAASPGFAGLAAAGLPRAGLGPAWAVALACGM